GGGRDEWTIRRRAGDGDHFKTGTRLKEDRMRSGSGMAALLGLVAAVVLAVGGCAPRERPGGTTDRKPGGGAAKQHDHSGWWCEEHGIPEHECSMCQDDVARACKAKGDWCELHDRAKSQCFKCDPSLKEKFAAKYRAKFGEDPPPITEEESKPGKQ